MECRIVSCRLVYHADKCSALFYSEFRRLLRKESLGRSLDAISAAAEEYGIQIHVQNFILGIVTLKFHGGNPLLEFYPDHLHLGKPGILLETSVRGYNVFASCWVMVLPPP